MSMCFLPEMHKLKLGQKISTPIRGCSDFEITPKHCVFIMPRYPMTFGEDSDTEYSYALGDLLNSNVMFMSCDLQCSNNSSIFSPTVDLSSCLVALGNVTSMALKKFTLNNRHPGFISLDFGLALASTYKKGILICVSLAIIHFHII